MVTVDSKPTRRAGPSRLLMLLLVALTMVVAAGAAFLVLRTRGDALDRPQGPLSDEQSKAQVVEPAKEIVALAKLHSAVGGYILMSCKNRTDPPYQGAIYLTFDVPRRPITSIRLPASLQLARLAAIATASRYLSGTTISKNGALPSSTATPIALVPRS